MAEAAGPRNPHIRLAFSLFNRSGAGRATLLTAALVLGLPRGMAEQSWNELGREARRQGHQVELPDWPSDAAALEAKIRREVRAADRQFERMLRQTSPHATFENCVTPLDALEARLTRLYNECFLLRELSPNPGIRSRASTEVRNLQEARQRLAGHPRLFESLQQVHSQNSSSSDEQRHVVALFLGDAIRAGAHLPEAARVQLQSDWRRLDELCAAYDSNLRRAQGFEKFSRAELEGVPSRLLELPNLQTGPSEFTLPIHKPWQFTGVMEHAAREETRRRVLAAQYRLAPENVALLRDILALRHQQARRLAAPSWAHLQTETAWVGDPQTAHRLLAAYGRRMEPQLARDMAQLRHLKAELDQNTEAKVQLWDWRYLRTQVLTRQIGFDPQAYRPFFSLTRTLGGLFGLAEYLLGVRITQLDPPQSWAADVILAVALDATTDRPLGLLYLDLFARDGKQNRFAQFDLIPAYRLSNGRAQCPVVVLTANFPRPNATEAVGLTPRELQSVYHEFGHALHALMVETDYARIWRERGPRDYSEVPALVLEHWARDPRTLKSWAANVRDPSEVIPDTLLHRLQLADQTASTLARSEQIAYARLDLDLHEKASSAADPVAAAETIFEEGCFPLPADPARSFPATLDHLTGYDVRYYSYVLAEAVAAQFINRFHQSPQGLLDPQLGRALRAEVFTVGGRRPAPDLLEGLQAPEGPIELPGESPPQAGDTEDRTEEPGKH